MTFGHVISFYFGTRTLTHLDTWAADHVYGRSEYGLPSALALNIDSNHGAISNAVILQSHCVVRLSNSVNCTCTKLSKSTGAYGGISVEDADTAVVVSFIALELTAVEVYCSLRH